MKAIFVFNIGTNYFVRLESAILFLEVQHVRGVVAQW